jgi:hypothetical protein
MFLFVFCLYVLRKRRKEKKRMWEGKKCVWDKTLPPNPNLMGKRWILSARLLSIRFRFNIGNSCEPWNYGKERGTLETGRKCRTLRVWSRFIFIVSSSSLLLHIPLGLTFAGSSSVYIAFFLKILRVSYMLSISAALVPNNANV